MTLVVILAKTKVITLENVPTGIYIVKVTLMMMNSMMRKSKWRNLIHIFQQNQSQHLRYSQPMMIAIAFPSPMPIGCRWYL